MNGVLLDNDEAQDVLKKFRKRWVLAERPARDLMWNHLTQVPRKMRLASTTLPENKLVYVLLEREEQVWSSVRFGSVVETLSALEPWEDHDVYVFDADMDWVLIHTHEDLDLAVGNI